MLTSVERHGATLPAGFAARFISDLAGEERARLVAFFAPASPASTA